MKTVVLLISLAFIFQYNAEAYSRVDLIGALNKQIKNMTTLMTIIKKIYSDDPYNSPPRQYFVTLDRAQIALDEARHIFGPRFFEWRDPTDRERISEIHRKSLKSHLDWTRPKFTSRTIGVVDGPDEDTIDSRAWNNERWDNRRSMGGGRLPERKNDRDETDRKKYSEFNAKFWEALSRVLEKDPVIAQRVRETYT